MRNIRRFGLMLGVLAIVGGALCGCASETAPATKPTDETTPAAGTSTAPAKSDADMGKSAMPGGGPPGAGGK